MSIKERKEREREEMRELILNTATEIIAEEGIESLSIRKIASGIEYSPAIIYHYFKDKEDIIDQVMQRGYKKIIQGLASVPQSAECPEQRLKALMRAYINTALEMPEEYKNAQLSSSPGALAYTSSLFKGASGKKPALAILCRCLKDILKEMQDDEIELTAQIITTATFGLIVRLITERDIDDNQKNRLIEHHIRCIIDSMILGKSLDNWC